jgi:hypothetical protein
MAESRSGSLADGDRPSVAVCRGCCCGNPARFPDVEHGQLISDLIAQLKGVAHVRTAACLLTCGAANVAVVVPAPRARLAGARAVWISRVLTLEVNRAIAAWVLSGGPGIAEIPADLTTRVTEPGLAHRRGSASLRCDQNGDPMRSAT